MGRARSHRTDRFHQRFPRPHEARTAGEALNGANAPVVDRVRDLRIRAGSTWMLAYQLCGSCQGSREEGAGIGLNTVTSGPS